MKSLDAKTKICPFIKYCANEKESFAAKFAIEYNQHCITIDCMAWVAESAFEGACGFVQPTILVNRLEPQVTKASYDGFKVTLMRSRVEAVAFIEEQLKSGPNQNNWPKHDANSYGKQELRELMDYLYGSVPSEPDEFIK